MRAKLFLFFLGLVCLSCSTETALEESSNDLNFVTALSGGNCINNFINPLWLSEPGSCLVESRNQWGNPIFTTETKISGYVSSSVLVNHSRTVTVMYSYTDKDSPNLEEILDIEDFVIPANKRTSATRPVLRDVRFKAVGTVRLSILEVEANGAPTGCYVGREFTIDFANCQKEPNPPPKLELPKL